MKYNYSKEKAKEVLKKYAEGGKVNAGTYRVGNPIKVGNMYEQKVAIISSNGDIRSNSEFGMTKTDFISMKYPKISEKKFYSLSNYAEGGSLGNHGLKHGDQIIKTMSGGVQKVKTKTGDIVYVNLANGYRGAEPPLPFATGGVTKNYVQRKELNTITIKKGDQKLTYKVSDVYNGAYKLEDGGKLEKLAFYVPKRNVVKVQLRDGKDLKVANGYWIKKGAKPIHTSKYDDGGNLDGVNPYQNINSIRERYELLNDMYYNEESNVDYTDILKVGDVVYGDDIQGYARIYKEVNDPEKGDYFIFQDRFNDKFAFYIIQSIRGLRSKELFLQNVGISEKDFLYSPEVININQDLNFAKGRVRLYEKNPNNASNYHGINYDDYISALSKIKPLEENLRLMLKEERHKFENGGQLEIKFAKGGSLGNHGLKHGDQIIKTMAGGVQKVKTKTGDIVYVNLANGYRGAEPPLPFATGGGINWHKYPTKKVSGLYEIKGGEINRKVNIVGFERYDDDLYSLYPLDRDRDIFKEIFVKSTSLNSLDKGVSVKGETNDGKKVSIKRIGNKDFSYAEGGVTKNYVQRKELNTITIKKGDQKLTYKVSDVYNGAYKLEDGGKLEKLAFYVPKRNVVKVQLKTGKDVKVANGYWIKKGAKPIHTSKYDDGGFMADVYADGGSVESKVDELYEKSTFINDDYNWKSKLLEMLQDNSIEAYNIYQSLNDTQKEEVLQELYEMDNDFGSEGDGDIETSKENLSYLLDDAKNGKKYANGGVIGKEMTFYRHGEEEKGIVGEVNEDGSYNVATKYSIILVEPQDVISINDAPKKKGFFFAKGGNIVDDSDLNINISVGKWGGADIGDGEYFMDDFKSLVESKPQFFIKTEKIKDYYETTVIPNPFQIEDLEGVNDEEYIEMFKYADVYITTKFDILNFLKNNDGIGIYNIVPSKKTGKIEIGDMAWYELGLNSLGSLVSHTLVKESPKYKELLKLYNDNKPYKFSMAKGGGFEKLSNQVAKNFEGKKVEPKYQKEYGKTYDKSEAKEVGNKIAGSQKANQKMATGGTIERKYNSMSKDDKEELMTEKIGVGRTPFSQYEKYSQLSPYHKEMVDKHFSLKKMAEKFGKIKVGDFLKKKGSNVKVKVIEVGNDWRSGYDTITIYNDVTNDKTTLIDWSDYEKTNFSTGGKTKRGGAMQLAKQIRKEGESWQSALKRANAQVRNK